MPVRKISDFERMVYAAVKLVPRGSVTTYGLIARYLGRGSPRAVGQALKRNPSAPRVPCHRVIASDMSLGGFRGSEEDGVLSEKARLLLEEGVEFKHGKLVDTDRIHAFER